MAKEKEPKALPAGETAGVPKKPSRVKKIVIILLILLIVLSAGGGGAYWWLYLRPAPSPEEKSAPVAVESQEAAPAPAEPVANAPRVERETALPRSAGKVLPLPAVVVNISDASGRRKLKLGMEVEVNSDVSRELKANSARIRDAVIMILAGKTYADIASPEGKVLLKGELAARLNQILGAQRVVRIYFTDFVVE